MSVYRDCLRDTFAKLIEVALESEAEASRSKGEEGYMYDVGRAEAIAQTLHSWKNQFLVFGLLDDLGRTGADLVEFCRERGLP